MSKPIEVTLEYAGRSKPIPVDEREAEVMLKTTCEQLEKLTALEEQATPGPWESQDEIQFESPALIKFQRNEGGKRVMSFLATCETYKQPNNENAAVIAESRNALAALLHDAAVAHRLVDGISAAISDLRAQIMAEFPHPSEENRRNNDHLEGWITGARQIAYDLGALLSAAKEAE